ncbi:MAG: hypothetical protein ACRELB_20260, partial [Polyangiaceae bacterium]
MGLAKRHPRPAPGAVALVAGVACACVAGACGQGGSELGAPDAAAGDAAADAPDAADDVLTADAPPDDPGPQLDVPVLQVGDDAFRRWDLWPAQRIGMRAVMRSTYDRSGGNEAADASHFLRETASSFVALDLQGQGELRFFRANRWHGSPWHWTVDGADTVVTETNTAHPDAPTPGAAFLPAAAFPAPLALTGSATAGADVSWVPAGFTRSLSLGYERTHYGTGYYVAYLYPPGATDLSQPLAAWTAQPPAQDVVELVGRAGQDIAPADASVTTASGQLDLVAGATTTVVALTGSSTLRALRFTVPLGQEQALGDARIRITWDDRAAPSVDAPVALFFGAGTLYNR